jgi:uncharacterized protein YbaR (Trm112 family)
MNLDSRLIAILSCPACNGHLLLKEAELSCVECGEVYPIVQDIPILIERKAIKEKEER